MKLLNTTTTTTKAHSKKRKKKKVSRTVVLPELSTNATPPRAHAFPIVSSVARAAVDIFWNNRGVASAAAAAEAAHNKSLNDTCTENFRKQVER